MNLPNNKLDSLNIQGLQSIDDHVAESCSGGNNISVVGVFERGDTFPLTTLSRSSFFNAGVNPSVDAAAGGVDRIRVSNRGANGAYVAVLADNNGQSVSVPQQPGFLNPGQSVVTDIPGANTRGDSLIAVGVGSSPERAQLLASTQLNDARAFDEAFPESIALP